MLSVGSLLLRRNNLISNKNNLELYIVLDVDNKGLDKPGDLCYSVARQMKEACQAVPENFKRQFGKEFNLPLNVEIKAGNDLLSILS